MKPMYAMQKFLEKCADHFAGESDHHATMSKGWDEDSEQHASCKDRAAACSKLAKTCSSLADKCGKAESAADFEKMFGEDGDAIVPTQVSRIAPDNPQTKLKMVLRAGMPTPETPKPDPQFAKLFSMDDGSEEA
jgi:hypothetical protein